MRRSFAIASLCVMAWLLLAVPLALAHAFVDHCAPALGSTNAQPPAEVRCVFSDAVDAKQTHLQVVDASNNRVDHTDVQSDPNDRDGKTVCVTLNTAKITGGVYTVKWDTVAPGGDKTDGQFQFSVGAQERPAPATGQPAPSNLPKTGADNSSGLGWAALLALGGAALLGLARALRNSTT